MNRNQRAALPREPGPDEELSLEAATVSARRVAAGKRMLVARRSRAVTSKDGADRAVVNAGRTQVSPDHWLAKEQPDLFEPATESRTRAGRAGRKPTGSRQPARVTAAMRRKTLLEIELRVRRDRLHQLKRQEARRPLYGLR